MMPLQDFVGMLATFFTSLLFFSGGLTCKQIWQQRAVDNVSPFPFLSGVVNCFLWLQYGIYVSDNIMIALNGTGLALHIGYSLFYLYFSYFTGVLQKAKCLQMILVSFILMTMLHILPDFFVDSLGTKQIFFGICASVGVIMFISSPLMNIAHVIRTKNTDILPFTMILLSFIMASLWTLYGVIGSDIFVVLPNLFGSLMAFFQLTLFAMYPKYKRMQKIIPLKDKPRLP